MFLGFSSMNTAQDPPPSQLAKTLEDAGFESLWYGEHSHIPCSRHTPYPPGGELPEPYKNMMDPYVSLTAAAMATTTLKLGTGIALLMERDLFAQAKTIATLERLSNGRLLIGTGVGWNREEFENTSAIPFNKRYRGLKETVAATRTLFSDPQPEYHGEFIDFDPVWFAPKPLKMPPFIFGAMGPVGIRHAAEWADGWMPVDIAIEDMPQAIRAFRQQVRDFGRDPDTVEITIVIMSALNADQLKHYRDMGVTRCNIGVGIDNWNKPEIIMPMIEQCAKIISEL